MCFGSDLLGELHSRQSQEVAIRAKVLEPQVMYYFFLPIQCHFFLDFPDFLHSSSLHLSTPSSSQLASIMSDGHALDSPLHGMGARRAFIRVPGWVAAPCFLALQVCPRKGIGFCLPAWCW